MRLAVHYAEPGGWYYEWCTRADTLAEATACIYPDVGCIHQGYNMPDSRVVDAIEDGKPVKRTVPIPELEARAESLASATAFLVPQLARATPAWEAFRVHEERTIRARAKRQALEERVLAEERARLGPPAPRAP